MEAERALRLDGLHRADDLPDFGDRGVVARDHYDWDVEVARDRGVPSAFRHLERVRSLNHYDELPRYRAKVTGEFGEEPSEANRVRQTSTLCAGVCGIRRKRAAEVRR